MFVCMSKASDYFNVAPKGSALQGIYIYVLSYFGCRLFFRGFITPKRVFFFREFDNLKA